MPTYQLRVKRQDAPGGPSRWEDFAVERRENMNVISALMEIQKHPRTSAGAATTPVAWECSCLEEVCGACTMVVNGRVRQACSTLLANLAPGPIALEPMRRFPVLRDLMVDRGRMFANLKKVRAWVPLDGYYDLGPGPRIPQQTQREMYQFSECMTCGCCLDACPQFNARSDFVGAQILGQVLLFNRHPTGAFTAGDRLDAIMGPGGITDCGNAQVCVEVCPKDIPLTDAIAQLGRDTTMHGLFGWLRRK